MTFTEEEIMKEHKEPIDKDTECNDEDYYKMIYLHPTLAYGNGFKLKYCKAKGKK